MLKIDYKISWTFYSKVIFSRFNDQSIKVLSTTWMNVTKCFSTKNTSLMIMTMILLNNKINDTMIFFNIINVLCRSHFNIKTLNIIVNAFIIKLIKITSLLNTFISVEINIDTTKLMKVIDAINSISEKLMSYNALISFDDDDYWLNLLKVEIKVSYYSFIDFINKDSWFKMLSSAKVIKIKEYIINIKALMIDSLQLF